MRTPKPTILLAHYPDVQLVADADLDRLDDIGTVVDREAIGSWDDPRAGDLLAAADVILGHWGCPFIGAAVLDRAPRLGLFAYAAGTIKATVDRAVFDRGIRVTTCADANAEPVAEFTLAAVLFANKDVLWRRDRLRDPGLAGFRTYGDVAVGNYSKTIGIIGASLVGRRVIELLSAFPALRIVLYDPYVTDDEADRLGVTRMELDELCAAADVVSIHAPDLVSTRHLVAGRQLAAMRDGATLINTARGALLDHDALRAEASAGRLYAMLDVTDPEPLADDDGLRTLPNVFLTPHLAGSEGTELARLSDWAIDEIVRWSEGAPARNGIDAKALDRMA